jgi:hypothetical protein
MATTDGDTRSTAFVTAREYASRRRSSGSSGGESPDPEGQELDERYWRVFIGTLLV